MYNDFKGSIIIIVESRAYSQRRLTIDLDIEFPRNGAQRVGGHAQILATVVSAGHVHSQYVAVARNEHILIAIRRQDGVVLFKR